MKLKKRVFSLMLAMLLMLTCICVPAFAAETVFEPTIVVNNDTRQVQFEGRAIVAPGSRVTIAVWYPDKSASNLLAGEDIKTVNAYTQELVLDSESKYSHSFYLTPDAISGIYTLTVNIPGYDKPQNYTFVYRNLSGARLVLNTTKTGTAAEIMSVLNNGLVHVNVETSLKYNTFTAAADRGYIASYVEKNRPVGEEDAGFASLASIVEQIMMQMEKTRELASAERETVRDAVLEDSATYMINSDDLAIYNSLSETKQERVIADVKSAISEALYPEDVRDAFALAVAEAAESKTESGDSQPGGSGGGSKGTTSLKAGNDLVALGGVNDKLTAVDSFGDLSSCEWAKDEINTLAGKGIVNGKGDGKFCPNDNITREELLKLLITAFGVRAASASAVPFNDVEYGTWYYDSIATAYQLKIVSGMSNDYFGVGLNVTRQDMVVMLYNVLYKQGITLEAEGDTVIFADKDDIAEYASRAVDSLSSAKIINGQSENRFAPTAPATRAEAVKIIYETLYRLNLL